MKSSDEMTAKDGTERRTSPKNGRRDARLQLMVASTMVLAGCVLLGCGFALPPKGEIHSSVLVAFGEILTFAGALFGIDYRYRAG